MKKSNWNRAKGTICPECGQETLRLIYGICLSCARRKTVKDERKLEISATVKELRRQLKKR